MSKGTQVLSVELGCENFFLHVERRGGPILLYVRGRQEGSHSEHLLAACDERQEMVTFVRDLIDQLDAIRYDLQYGGYIGDVLEMCGEAPAKAERRAAEEEAQTDGDA